MFCGELSCRDALRAAVASNGRQLWPGWPMSCRSIPTYLLPPLPRLLLLAANGVRTWSAMYVLGGSMAHVVHLSTDTSEYVD